HFRLSWVTVRIDVDQLYYPVAVRTAGRSEQMRDYVPADSQIFIENICLPRQHVIPSFEKSLILHQPGVPGRSSSIGRLDGSLAIRNRIGRIRNVTFRLLIIFSRGFIKRQRLTTVKVEITGGGFFRRPVI